jgi:hypothetical protein
MTVTSQTKKVTTTGDSSATTFSFSPIVIFSSSDLEVVTTVIATGVETVRTEGTGTTNWSLSLTAFPATGSITYPASGSAIDNTLTITIRRKLTLEQQTDLNNQGGYFPDVQEDQFDKLVMIDLQQQENLDRAFAFPISYTGGASIEMPTPIANTFLVWNPAGDGLTTSSDLSGQFLAGNGTVSLPFYSYADDPDSGWYRVGANSLGLAVNGAIALGVQAGGIDFYVAGAKDMTLGANKLTVQAGTEIVLVGDGTAIGAANAITFGAGEDGAIYSGGSNLKIDVATALDIEFSGTADFTFAANQFRAIAGSEIQVLGDGTAIGAANAIVFGAGEDGAIYSDGAALVVDAATSLLIKEAGSALATFDLAGNTLTMSNASAPGLTVSASSGSYSGSVVRASSNPAEGSGANLFEGLVANNVTQVFRVSDAGLLECRDITLTASNPDIIGGDTDGVLSITADTATNQGGNIKLYGNTHATKAQDIEFRADTTVVAHWDESANTWALTGEVTATGFTGTLDGVLGGGTPAAATVVSLTFSGANPDIFGADTDGRLLIGPSTAADLGGQVVLYGDTHATKAGDIDFLSDANLRGSWDESTATWDFNNIDGTVIGANTPAGATVTTLTAGTLTIGAGSITDSSGAISFGNENLTTTGAVNSGQTTALSSSASAIGFTSNMTHATYTGSAIRAQSTRAANSGFNLVEGLVDAGGTQVFKVAGDGEVTATGFTGTLDGVLGGGTPAAATVTTINGVTAPTAQYTSAEATKLSGIETAADVTDATNVAAALTNGVAALASGEVTQLANIGAAAISAAEWGYVAASTQAYDAADHTKLNGIEALADVTDATNVLAGLVGQEAVATGFTGTLDGVLGGGTPAAVTATTIAGTTGTFSGIVSVDDTTDSTSGTTGSIHTDGGLGVAKDITLSKTLNFDADDTYPGANLHYAYRDATNGLAFMGQGSSRAVTFLVPNSGAISLWQTTNSAQWNSAGPFRVDDTTNSTSATTGSIQTDGGLGVAKDVFVGGVVTKPLQPAFQGIVTASTTNVTGNGATETMVCVEQFDQGGDYDGTTFTAPVTGRYWLHFQFRMDGITAAADTVSMAMVTSNATFRQYFQHTNDWADNHTFQMSQLCTMDASDTVTFQINATGEASDVWDVSNTQGASYCCGWLVA